MTERFINIKIILDNLLQHPLLQDLTLERAVAYTIDFMRIVGMPDMFVEKVEKINIRDYRGELPCDFYEIIQVRDKNVYFRYSTDSFHYNNDYNDNTYKIQGNIIFTSLKNGEIEISYRAISIDCDGYPLIPDNSNFTRALELYIKKQWFTILFDLGKISPQVYNNVQQEYAWAVGSCQTDMSKLSIDKMEALKNSWCTLLMRKKEHSTGFKTNSIEEKYKTH